MAEPRVGGVDELELVRAVAAGSQDALAALYDRHAEAIFALALRTADDRGVAEEVVQETFLALWNRAELFDPATGSLGTWLRSIARNRAIDRLRAAGRRPRFIPLVIEDGSDGGAEALERAAASGTVVAGAAPEPGPEATLSLTETRESIRGALATMPDVERLVIVLAYQEELSQSEIAERLGWPLGTVKTRTRRALRRLRFALGASLGSSDAPDGLGEPDDEDTPAAPTGRMTGRWTTTTLERCSSSPPPSLTVSSGSRRATRPRRPALAGHLAGCPSCAAEVEVLGRVSTTLRSVIRELPAARAPLAHARLRRGDGSAARGSRARGNDGRPRGLGRTGRGWGAAVHGR